MTKYHRLGGLNNGNVFLHSSGGFGSPRPGGQHDQVLLSLSSWLADAFSWSSAWRKEESKLSGVSFYKGTNPIMRAPPLPPYPNNHLSQSPPPNTVM